LTPLIVTGVAALVITGAGGLLTEIGPWYRQLRKPSWQPPDWLFGPAWTLILALAAWSAALAWTTAPTAGERTIVVILYSLNGLFHLFWSPLFFKLKRPDWALLEVPLLWLSVLAPMLFVVWFSPLASLLLLPYLLWVTFAAYLNLTIVRLNGPFTTR
jgi:tryptophan-rich sensory protein